jgi:hypothetical protein
MALARTVAVIVPSPAISFVFCVQVSLKTKSCVIEHTFGDFGTAI